MQLTILFLFMVATVFPAVSRSQSLHASEVDHPVSKPIKTAHQLNLEYLALHARRDSLSREMVDLQRELSDPDHINERSARLVKIDSELRDVRVDLTDLEIELQTARDRERRDFGSLPIPPIKLQTVGLWVRLVDVQGRLTIGQIRAWDPGHREMIVSVLEIKKKDGSRAWHERSVDFDKLEEAYARVPGQGHKGFVVGQEIRLRYGPNKKSTYKGHIAAMFEDGGIVFDIGIDPITGLQSFGLVPDGDYFIPDRKLKIWEVCSRLLFGVK